MGVCLTYTAILHSDPDTICEQLRLRRTGEQGEFHDTEFAGIELRAGWYLIITNRSLRLVEDSILATLSADTMVLSCFVEEHVMYSTLSVWENGKETWSVTCDHNDENGLEVTGVLPEEISGIVQEHVARQRADEGVDHLFELPVAVMAHHTGFRHDRSNAEADGKFERLKPIRTGFLHWLYSLLNSSKAT